MVARPLSILLFTRTTARYGVEEHMLTLLRRLPRDSFRLALACPSELAQQISSDVPADVELLALPFGESNALRNALLFARSLHRLRVDVLHSHLFFSSRFASPLGCMCRVPVILETAHVAENWRTGWKSSFWMDRTMARCVDYFIAVSEANAKYLTEKKGLPKEKVMVIANGCDLSRFDANRAAPAGLRESLGIGEGDPIVLVPARLEPQKGHRVLLEALPIVRQQFPNVKVICVGAGSLRDELENRVAALGLASTVKFVGFQAGMEDWLALCDFAVLPSFYEGLPLAAVESLAMKRAVVATAVDGTPEVVVHGLTGLTVPPGDAVQLADAIRLLLYRPELRRKYGQRGRERVEEHFSQELQVQRTSELYLQAWEQKRGAKEPAGASPARHSRAA